MYKANFFKFFLTHNVHRKSFFLAVGKKKLDIMFYKSKEQLVVMLRNWTFFPFWFIHFMIACLRIVQRKSFSFLVKSMFPSF